MTSLSFDDISWPKHTECEIKKSKTQSVESIKNIWVVDYVWKGVWQWWFIRTMVQQYGHRGMSGFQGICSHGRVTRAAIK